MLKNSDMLIPMQVYNDNYKKIIKYEKNILKRKACIKRLILPSIGLVIVYVFMNQSVLAGFYSNIFGNKKIELLVEENFVTKQVREHEDFTITLKEAYADSSGIRALINVKMKNGIKRSEYLKEGRINDESVDILFCNRVVSSKNNKISLYDYLLIDTEDEYEMMCYAMDSNNEMPKANYKFLVESEGKVLDEFDISFVESTVYKDSNTYTVKSDYCGRLQRVKKCNKDISRFICKEYDISNIILTPQMLNFDISNKCGIDMTCLFDIGIILKNGDVIDISADVEKNVRGHFKPWIVREDGERCTCIFKELIDIKEVKEIIINGVRVPINYKCM